jgi:hypothetical protein
MLETISTGVEHYETEDHVQTKGTGSSLRLYIVFNPGPEMNPDETYSSF